jgi:hypothetical protein
MEVEFPFNIVLDEPSSEDESTLSSHDQNSDLLRGEDGDELEADDDQGIFEERHMSDPVISFAPPNDEEVRG